jgi:hypothetical protein
MNCETVSGYLPELLAGALGRETELEVLTHLARCEDCRKELAFWVQVAKVVLAETEPMPLGLFKGIRNEMFGIKTSSALDGLKLAGQALGLAGSACRLALSMAGK